MFELRAETALSYLAARGWDAPGAQVRELGGGVSNAVLLVEGAERRFVLKQALGKLRVEQDWFSDRSRIFRESGAIGWIAPYLRPGAVPGILFEDRDNGLIAMTGAPAGACTWKSLLLGGRIEPAVAEEVGGMLSTIVRATWRDAACERTFGDQTIFDQLRLDPYYRFTAARYPELRAGFERLMEDSRGRRVSLVHGDWSPKNFLISPGAVMAIDFEVAHFGDPSFDVAFMLNHLLLKWFYLPECRAALADAASRFWEACRAGLPSGAEWMEPMTLRHWGCLLLARVDGKSPAEYIRTPDLKESVRAFARRLIAHPPASIRAVFQQAQGAAP